MKNRTVEGLPTHTMTWMRKRIYMQELYYMLLGDSLTSRWESKTTGAGKRPCQSLVKYSIAPAHSGGYL